ncbi:hypothetical protein [Streptomyces sp. NPDC058145]|uniref:hypothetical protein n=1 Tax=Streptomyces sp. NPDC058145 TaxID=3346356 RepID=UPI0036EC984D
MRPEVQTFVADGPLPDWDASEEEIDRRVQQFNAILKPVTGEEAKALVACFGPDDCCGPRTGRQRVAPAALPPRRERRTDPLNLTA